MPFVAKELNRVLRFAPVDIRTCIYRNVRQSVPSVPNGVLFRLSYLQPGPIDGVPGIEPREFGGGIDEGIGRGRARSHFLSRVP